MANIIVEYLQTLTKWGSNTFFSIVLTLVIIGISLPFTYIGFAIRKAIEYRIKKYQCYAIKKYTRRALVGIILLFIAVTILFFVVNELIFFGVTVIAIAMIILGLLGFKLTFGLEEMIESWIDDI